MWATTSSLIPSNLHRIMMRDSVPSNKAMLTPSCHSPSMQASMDVPGARNKCKPFLFAMVRRRYCKSGATFSSSFFLVATGMRGKFV